jgi:8-oxo-dGTP pyrophosphatase MutT (NUDIX family)
MENETNPWRVLSQKEVYDNPWIQVTEYEVINPGGGRGIYGKIHFKHVAVGILPLDDSLHTWLVGQYRFTLDRYSWEIPEGGSLDGEETLDSARRELMEETGLEARDWSPLLTMHLSNSVSDEESVIYLARQLSQGTARPEETEQLRVRKISLDEAYQMVERGEITDSMTVAALIQAKLLRAQGRI